MLRKIGLILIAVFITALPLSGRVSAATTATNLISNPSMETIGTDGNPTGWTGDGWGTNTHTATVETTGNTGSRSLKTTISSYTDGDAKWYFNDVAVTGSKSYDYSNYYKSSVDSEIDVQITDTAGVQTYNRIVAVPASPNAWSKIQGQFTVPANAKSVTVYQVISAVGYIQVDDASLSLYTPTQLTRGMVSLTFDDGWLNQYTAAKPLLDKYGMKGTFYIITNTSDFPDYMTTTQIKALQTDGQEIGSHTVSHPDLTTLTASQLTSELSGSKTTLQSLYGSNSALNFASPYGAYNSNVVTEIKKYYKSHRSTDEGFNTKDNFDIYNIKVQNILDTTTPAQVAAWVAQAQAEKTWLVLVYHLVQNDPSTSEEDYAVTPANLETELASIKQSGIAVETMDQAIAEMQAQINGTTPPVVKPGDVNNDNTVDALDLSTVLSNWNKTGATAAQGDLNNDGTVDALDLSTVLSNWSK